MNDDDRVDHVEESAAVQFFASLFDEIVIPFLKDLLAESVIGALENLLGDSDVGRSRRSRSKRDRHFDYSRPSRVRRRRVEDEILFDSPTEASFALRKLKESDDPTWGLYLELAGMHTTPSDWAQVIPYSRLRNARVVRCDGGYTTTLRRLY